MLTSRVEKSDYDPHGPCGPTAFWKVSDRDVRHDNDRFVVNDYFPIVEGYGDDSEEEDSDGEFHVDHQVDEEEDEDEDEGWDEEEEGDAEGLDDLELGLTILDEFIDIVGDSVE